MNEETKVQEVMWLLLWWGNKRRQKAELGLQPAEPTLGKGIPELRGCQVKRKGHLDCTGMGGVKCYTVEVVFSTPPPPPFFSSFSTELTFKLWHQLPCQTGCDFPSLHLPRLPPGAVSPLAVLPSLFPAQSSLLCPSHSQNPRITGALLQVGNTAPLTSHSLALLRGCHQEFLLCTDLFPPPLLWPPNLHASPSPPFPHPQLFLLPHLPQPNPSKKPHCRDVPSA